MPRLGCQPAVGGPLPGQLQESRLRSMVTPSSVKIGVFVSTDKRAP